MASGVMEPDSRNPQRCSIIRVENGWLLTAVCFDGYNGPQFVFRTETELSKFISDNFEIPKPIGPKV